VTARLRIKEIRKDFMKMFKKIPSLSLVTGIIITKERNFVKMIKIIAGGKKHGGEYAWLIKDYQKRCRAPFDFEFKFYEGEKLDEFLASWPFTGNQFVILCDERGEIVSSPDFCQLLEKQFNSSKEVIVIIGAAFGVSEEVRERADFVLSFSKMVFPHMLSRLIISEQLYRAQEIYKGGSYHHE